MRGAGSIPASLLVESTNREKRYDLSFVMRGARRVAARRRQRSARVSSGRAPRFDPALAAACLVLAGCGARAELDAPGPDEGTTHARPLPQCSGWQPAGPLMTVSETEPADANDYLMSMIPSAGGALLGWVALGDAPTSTWRTLALGFDAAPRSPIETHLSFPTSDGPASISLAASGGSFAALLGEGATGNGGCQFLPLDEDGMEAGPAVSVDGWSEACAELAPTPDGFSFIASLYGNAGYFDLLNLDAKGSVLSRTPLPPPSGSPEDGWLALHDRSFLLATTDANGVATSVQRFSPGGAPLAAAAEITAGGSYVMPMVETSAGVLSAWGSATSADSSTSVCSTRTAARWPRPFPSSRSRTTPSRIRSSRRRPPGTRSSSGPRPPTRRRGSSSM